MSKVVHQLVRQLVYTMFITNYRVSFHLLWKENLAKHQKFSTYFENKCLQFFIIIIFFFFFILFNFIFFIIFFLLFMSLSTVPIVKKRYLAGIYFIFQKNVLKQTWKSFNTKFRPQCKDWKTSLPAKQILAFFCNLLAPILG